MDFINKLTVDRENYLKSLTERTNVHIKCFNGFENKDVRKLVEIIYRNFEELDKYPELNHHRKNILELLKSPNSIIILALHNDKIIGYLIAKKLHNMMHIFYLFVTPVRRNSSIATHMLNIIQEKTFDKSINILSITVDTYNNENIKFFVNNHFTYNDNLRTYKRFDNMVKYV